MECDSRYAGPQTDESEAYFNRILHTPPAAFAKFLYQLDLTGFNVARIPNTKYGAFQKELNLDPPMLFLDSFLKNDMSFTIKRDPLMGGDEEFSFPNDNQKCIVEKDVIFNMYLDMCKQDKYANPGNPIGFWKHIKNVIDDTWEPHNKPRGLRSIPITFPPISECKAAFCRFVREPKWFD
jgi:hypothetical protein